MPYTKEEIQPHLQQGVRSVVTPLTRGEQFMGRDVPEEYFVVQDWCISQGMSPVGSNIPDLSYTFQGLEYVFQAATGKYPNKKVLSKREIISTMHYLNREEYFNEGALRQFPEYQKVLKEQLLHLPGGKKVIKTIQSVAQFSDLFK